ncbi:MAG: isochorismate synthase [Symploca sp. SIO3C6]|uniref:Isochorismate synthase n=1 Tax=Symploca sp. SIO1C4 TaxID=2607765 RepID=A0A6B3N9S7_9CYAN|nr:isochorismate synthase [Symploca sp. SIO3C6]NER28360.1 isochorismate synthase [Symploca sp. SIO1C4]NET08321.1 isochorismate synthase [Symploca sp. SIO2B6]
MAGFKWLQQLLQYIGDGVRRIFGPRDDEYPETGVQPFEGEPQKEGEEIN